MSELFLDPIAQVMLASTELLVQLPEDWRTEIDDSAGVGFEQNIQEFIGTYCIGFHTD